MTDVKTLRDFCAKYSISAKSIEADSNPNTDWPAGTNHYFVTLIRPGGHKLTTPYSMGSALTGRPKAVDVLGCLLMDAYGVDDNQGFEGWASEYGYDTDSRKAEKTYHAVVRQTSKLKSFLGDLYQEAAEYEVD